LAKDRRQQQEEEEAAEAEKELFQQYRDAKRAQKASSGIISEEMHSGPIEPASSLQLKPTENSAAVFNRVSVIICTTCSPYFWLILSNFAF
jgi:hypothetical protein